MNSFRSRLPSGVLARARGAGAWTLYTSLAGQAMTLITGVIAARALGVEGRGTLALLWLVPLMLVLIGGLGVPQATTFYVAREREAAHGVISIALKVTAALAGCMLPVYGAVLVLLQGSGYEFSITDGLVSLALIPMLLIQNLGIASLLGLERYPLFNLARLGPVVIYAVGSGLLYLLGLATLTSILCAAMFAWMIAAGMTWTMIRRNLRSRTSSPQVTRGEIVRFGLRGVIGSVSPIDDVRVDQILVGVILDARALGLYVAAVAFCNLPRFVAQSLGAVSFPRIAAAGRTEAAWVMVRHYLRLGTFTVGAAVIVLLICVPVLLPLMFGDEFREAIGLSRILLLAAFFLSMHRLLTELARGLGHPGYGSITELINASVFLLGVVVVTGAATVQDVAWSVVAGGVASSTVLLLMLFSRYRGYQRAGGRSPDQ